MTLPVCSSIIFYVSRTRREKKAFELPFFLFDFRSPIFLFRFISSFHSPHFLRVMKLFGPLETEPYIIIIWLPPFLKKKLNYVEVIC